MLSISAIDLMVLAPSCAIHLLAGVLAIDHELSLICNGLL